MRIENTTTLIAKVAGLAIAPGRQANLPDDAVIPPGFRKLPDLPKVLTAHELLVQRIRFNRGGPRGLAMTRRGKPRCDVLARDMGRLVTGAQRDAAWPRGTGETRLESTERALGG